MLTINNIKFRNLEEQVLKNKQDIARHYAVDRALTNLGIKVVGQVTSVSNLPDPIFYLGEFGDAYAVGDKALVDAGEATYDYYIYTRPDVNAGEPTNYWLNVGKISIKGDRGPQGPKGEQGDPGQDAMWLTGSFDPSGLGGSYPNGTLYIVVNGVPASLTGNIYQFDSNLNQWELKGNIRGPQGIQGIQGLKGDKGDTGEQGPQGEKGDVGGFINIVGMLSNVGQLPLPSTIDNLTYAYLVRHTGGTDQANDHYDLYIQVGETSETAMWNNVGPFNAATLVTVGGEGQNVWDADTKLNKKTNLTQNNQVYVKSAAGFQTMYDLTQNAPSTGKIPVYATNGILKTNEPAADNDAANKAYVDTKITNCVKTVNGKSGEDVVLSASDVNAVPSPQTIPPSGSYRVYASYNGRTITFDGTPFSDSNTMVLRDTGNDANQRRSAGAAKINTVEDTSVYAHPKDIVNRTYVQNKMALVPKQLYRHDISFSTSQNGGATGFLTIYSPNANPAELITDIKALVGSQTGYYQTMCNGIVGNEIVMAIRGASTIDAILDTVTGTGYTFTNFEVNDTVTPLSY